MINFYPNAFCIRHEYVTDFYKRVPGNIHRLYPYLSREKAGGFVKSISETLINDELTAKRLKALPHPAQRRKSGF